MNYQTLTFQLAANYLSKIALCLEQLFITLEQGCRERHPSIHHHALKNLIEIIKLTEKPELKSRFIKELIRIEHALKKDLGFIASQDFKNLTLLIQELNHISGRFGHLIHNHRFLQSMRLIQTTNSCDGVLHPPPLLHWLENSFEKRQNDLLMWLEDLNTLNNTVRIYLNLLRDNVTFSKIDLHHGFYQCSLASPLPCQLILLSIDARAGMIPKMQLGHQSLNIRICNAVTLQDIKQITVKFELGISYL